MKCTNNHHLRRSIKLNCNEPSLTDQSMKEVSNINTIMKNYEKTGMLPQMSKKVARYIDNTGVPSLTEASEALAQARELFMELPSQVRKEMDNDPTKLVEFIQNPRNQEFLVEHGVILKQAKSDEGGSKEPESPASSNASEEA